jgi:biotin carboxyl carrier protein
MSRASAAFMVLIWLKLAGEAAFGDHRPTFERQWKGSAAILLVLAGALQLWRYRRGDRVTPPPAQSSTDQVPPASAAQSIRHDGPATPVTMPPLGEGVNEATVTHWLKQVGDHVEAGEPLVEVSTDKADTEIPADASGDLREIRVQAGSTAPVGTIIAMIEPSADRPSEASTAADRLGQG